MRLFVPRHLLRERGVVIGWHVQSDAPDSDVFICISTIPSESAHRFVPSDVAAAGVRDVADAWPRELTNAVFDRASSLLFRDITSAAVDRDDLVWSDVRVLGAWRVDGVERIANAVFTVSDDDETDDELGLLRVERVDGRRTPVQVVYVDVLSRSEYFVDCTSANVVSSDVWLQATSAPSVSASALSSVLSRMSRVDALGAAIDSVYVPKRHAARQSGILGRLGAVVQSVVVALVTLAMMPIAALLWLQSAVGRFGAVARLARISQFATSLRERAELADRWRARAPLLREAASDAAARRRQTMRVLQLRDDTVRVCVDVLLGFVAMLALLLVARDVTPSLSAIEAWLTHDVVRKLIVWMMGWPAGFKLNGPLSGFIGALFLLFVDSWTTVVVWCGLRDIPPPLVVVALVGPLGLSVQLALVVDLLNVFTLHVRCFYLVAARLHAAQWATLRSFWYLFRGRKHNVLRERIDTLHHDLEQLLLGTVLFTTLVFLAPTVAFYYVCFAALALALAAIRATLHAVRHAVLTLPFYGLLARAVHPAALPDSIVFELLGVAGAKVQAATTHLALRSVPLAAGALFGDVKAVIAATSAQVQLSSIVGRFVRGAARKETANAIEIAGGVRVQS
jgi:hypothetical protein